MKYGESVKYITEKEAMVILTQMCSYHSAKLNTISSKVVYEMVF